MTEIPNHSTIRLIVRISRNISRLAQSNRAFGKIEIFYAYAAQCGSH